MQGYIKLHRQMMDSDDYRREPFCKNMAWIDLLMLANHKKTVFEKRGVEVIVERGQLARSIKELCDRWQWSNNKVKGFLKKLENAHQILVKITNVTTLISILNYDQYQDNNTDDAHQKHTKCTPDAHQKHTKCTHTINDKNVKNEKNVKEVKVTANKSRNKNTEFIDFLISDFADSYKQANGIDYIPSSMGKERAAIGWILQEYKNKNPDNDSEMTRSGLKHYFNLCVNINDNWLRQNMSLSILRSKFNEINNILKNGNRKGNRKGATPEEIAEVVAKHFATDYPTE